MKIAMAVSAVLALGMFTAGVIMISHDRTGGAEDKERLVSHQVVGSALYTVCIPEVDVFPPYSLESNLSSYLTGFSQEGFFVQRKLALCQGWNGCVLLELIRNPPFLSSRHYVRLVALKRDESGCRLEKVFDRIFITFPDCPCWEVESAGVNWRDEKGQIHAFVLEE